MSSNIVMAFLPRSIVGCLLKKGYKGGGGESRAHQDPLGNKFFLHYFNSHAEKPNRNELKGVALSLQHLEEKHNNLTAKVGEALSHQLCLRMC